MALGQGFLSDRQRTAVERLGLGESVLGPEELGQFVQARGDQGMIRA